MRTASHTSIPTGPTVDLPTLNGLATERQQPGVASFQAAMATCSRPGTGSPSWKERGEQHAELESLKSRQLRPAFSPGAVGEAQGIAHPFLERGLHPQNTGRGWQRGQALTGGPHGVTLPRDTAAEPQKARCALAPASEHRDTSTQAMHRARRGWAAGSTVPEGKILRGKAPAPLALASFTPEGGPTTHMEQ